MGKQLVISGGTAGIGKVISVSFAIRGYDIVFLTHNIPMTEELINELSEQFGGNYDYRVCEVTNEVDVHQTLTELTQTLGDIDVFVNNAGYGPSISGYPLQPITEISEQTWDNYLDNCLKGIFFSMKYELQIVKEQKHGVIINTVLEPVNYHPEHLLYDIAKNGIRTLTQTAQNGFSDATIRVSLVEGDMTKGDKEWNRIVAEIQSNCN